MKFSKNPGILKGFFQAGVSQSGRNAGKEYCVDCIFCSRENKLYINTQNGAWQCKVCGEQGGYLKFLETVSKYNQNYITEEHLQDLATNRKLPLWALEGYGIGFDGIQYTYPYYGYDGSFVGLRFHNIKAKTPKPMSFTNSPVGLFMAQEISERKDEPLFLVEGEGDVFALRYLLKTVDKPGIVIGTPGANIFKAEWEDYFYHRDVIVCYDNDEAGMDGEMKVYEMLSSAANSMKFLHWPLNHAKFPAKYDIRDFVTSLAVAKNKPKTTYKRLMSWLEEVPRKALIASDLNKDGDFVPNVEGIKDAKPATYKEVIAAFREYLYLPDTTPIKVMLAVVLANRIRSERLWMFFVAPPSNAKTEFLNALTLCPETKHITQLTDKTLVSGWMGQGNAADPSLMAKLNNKNLIIKDFTPILTMPPISREVIYSQLRDAYDGKLEKQYGNNVFRSYRDIHFGILAAVTGTIERTALMQQTLGERFLRYTLPVDNEDMSKNSEEKIMLKNRKAFDVATDERDSRKIVQVVTRNFLQFHKPPAVHVPDRFKDKLIYLGRLTAAMRGVVDRDFKERVIYKPSKEGPMRILKQFKLLVIGLASVDGRPEVSEEDYTVLKRIALSSTPSRVETIMRVLHNASGPLKGTELQAKTRFDKDSIIPIVKDILLLDLIKETKIGGNMFYELSELSNFYIKQSEVYA